MARRDVNDRQRAILGWIADGCPERDWPDETHKHSARALATRGLVKVSRSSGRWSAALTEDGKYFHQHGKYPVGHRFGPKPREPARPVDAPTAAEPVSKRGRSKAPSNDTVNNCAVDSPLRLKRRGKGTLAGSPEDAPTHPWAERVLISVKEAAWLLSVSEGLIREAVRTGDIDRVYIGAGTTNYRVVHDSLLAWVNTMPTEPVRRRW